MNCSETVFCILYIMYIDILYLVISRSTIVTLNYCFCEQNSEYNNTITYLQDYVGACTTRRTRYTARHFVCSYCAVRTRTTRHSNSITHPHSVDDIVYYTIYYTHATNDTAQWTNSWTNNVYAIGKQMFSLL